MDLKDTECETLKLLEENIRETLQDVSIGNDFLNTTAIELEIIARTGKWN
jgi:hypothetical protein